MKRHIKKVIASSGRNRCSINVYSLFILKAKGVVCYLFWNCKFTKIFAKTAHLTGFFYFLR